MGAEERNEHEMLVALLDEYKWDGVILVGSEFRGISDKYLWFATSAEAAAYVKEQMPADASILIKGSRGSRMELLAEAL